VAHSIITKTQQGLFDKGRVDQFIILTSFGLFFLIARLVTYLQKIGFLPDQQGPNHIHHLVPGIIFALIGGYVGLAFFNRQRTRWLASAVFGIGAALTLDEFALWLNLKDVYWQDEGRVSIDAVIVTVTLLMVIFFISEAHDHQWFPFKKSN
jgi:hypothetical protein